jgi:hypothetical protein
MPLAEDQNMIQAKVSVGTTQRSIAAIASA